MPNLLKINNLSFCYRNIFNLENINFSLERGEIFGIIGESGSGKTILSHSILRLFNDNDLSNLKGSIEFEDKNLLNLSRKQMQVLLGKDISYIPQEPLSALNPLHSIYKQITEIIKIHNKNIDSKHLQNRFLELLNFVGLDNSFAKRFPHELSGGQRQRVLIAIAIANYPKIIIADEPTTALDVNLQIQVLELLKTLKDKFNISIILITHNVNIIAKYASNIIVLKNGKVVESGIIDIFSNPKSKYLQTLLSSINIKHKVLNNSSNLLKVQNLCIKYISKKHIFGVNEYKNILNNISFDLKLGSILGVVGESGSGKSTLALALINLLKYSGNIIFDNKNYKEIKDFRHFRKNIQIVFQDPFSSLNPRHRVENIIKEGLNIHYKDSKDFNKMVLDFLECVGLDDSFAKRFPHELSGGQRQRVAIARALIIAPKLLILDEPTSALDKITQKNILELLLNLREKFNLTYILITHDLEIVNSICDEIIILKDGSIVESGKIDILENPKNNYTKILMESIL